MCKLQIRCGSIDVRFVFFDKGKTIGHTIATAMPGFKRGQRFIVFNDPGMSNFGFKTDQISIEAPDSTPAKIRKAGAAAIRLWFPFLPKNIEISLIFRGKIEPLE